MKVALRALCDVLERAGAPADVWCRVMRHIDPSVALGTSGGEIAVALRREGLSTAAPLLVGHMAALGVLGDHGRVVPDRSQLVAAALEMVGDSFKQIGPAPSWSPVATLPPKLRDMLRPPAVRQTAGVLLELIESARSRIMLATPFTDVDAVEFVSGPLLDAGRRGVHVRILTSRRTGEVFRRLGKLWSCDVGSTFTVTEVTTELSELGSHAKILLADGERGYVGSANLTAAGLGRHIEIGIEVRGPQADVLEQLLSAIERVGRTVLSAG